MIKCSIKDTKPVNTFQFERKWTFTKLPEEKEKEPQTTPKLKNPKDMKTFFLVVSTSCRLLTVVINDVNRVLILREADSSALGQAQQHHGGTKQRKPHGW